MNLEKEIRQYIAKTKEVSRINIPFNIFPTVSIKNDQLYEREDLTPQEKDTIKIGSYWHKVGNYFPIK